ncbi:hypothetical protein FI667_g4357, partial [Globisporangium splendens]
MKTQGLFVLAALALHLFGIGGTAVDVDGADKYESSQLLHGIPADNQALGQSEFEAAGTATTTPVTKIRFRDQLQSDADAFIADVKTWIAGVIGDVLANTNVVTESTFALEIKGEFDLGKPCAALTAYKAFDVIRGFLDDPKHATLSDAAAETIMWHPSEECVAPKNSVEVDGGAHVEFIATCDNELLLNASSATGSVTKTQYFKKVETTGAFVGVDYFDGDIRAVGATGRLIANLKLCQIPSKVDSLLVFWRHIVRECAAQNSLQIKGVVGGGWKQRYSKYGRLVGAYDTSVLGYAKAFEIRYQGLPVVPPELSPSLAPVKFVPVTEAPATTVPQTELPATTILVTEAPVTEASDTEAPVTDAPEPDAPPAATPVAEAPDTQSPAPEEPSSETRETEAPIALVPPATNTSVTEAPVATNTPAHMSGSAALAPGETSATESPTQEPTSDASPAELPGTEDDPTYTQPNTEVPIEIAEGEHSAGSSASGLPSALEPTTEPPATTSSETITEAPPSIAESASFDPTPFVFSRIDTDLSIMRRGIGRGGRLLYGTAMAKVLHGRLSEVVLDMNVRKDSSEKRTDAAETGHSMVSRIGFSTFSLAVLVYAAKRTRARRHGYAAIPNGTESINAETI